MITQEESFPTGKIQMPPDEGDLTAGFDAFDWGELQETWKFRTHLTEPGDGDSVEMPSVSVTIDEENGLEKLLPI